ncbi:hypothetical protein B0H13DRAFT_1904772 [Mycena leptocephala]|nr:hypothetical protein B0H13DRAFT_1904772 [Mycena leptocephala]
MATGIFNAQELVNHCIYFLRGSMRDLKACALVSPSWVYAAQSFLFREVSVADYYNQSSREISWPRFRVILEESSHLIRHIRRLNMEVTATVLLDICDFPFTHLQHVQVQCHGSMLLQHALGLQQLFSLPTLLRVKLTGRFTEPADYLAAFRRCSHSLEKLDLFLSNMKLPTVTDRQIAAPIPLTSLLISAALAIFSPAADRIVWPDLAPIMQTLKVLRITTEQMDLNLSMCPNLTVLAIFTVPWLSAAIQRDAIAALASTITAAPYGVMISFYDFLPELCKAVDAILDALSLRVVEVQFYPAKNMVGEPRFVLFVLAHAETLFSFVSDLEILTGGRRSSSQNCEQAMQTEWMAFRSVFDRDRRECIHATLFHYDEHKPLECFHSAAAPDK